ncbi:MAG: hypothetical protein WD969_01170 [Paracoccaceae bacterium]
MIYAHGFDPAAGGHVSVAGGQGAGACAADMARVERAADIFWFDVSSSRDRFAGRRCSPETRMLAS